MTGPGRPGVRRLVAVSHQATLTGAPMVLAHLLRWLSDHGDVDLHTVLLEDGPMRPRFEAVGPVTVVDRGVTGRTMKVAARGMVELGFPRGRGALDRLRLAPQLRHLRGADVVYLNSLASIEVAPHLPPSRLRVAHVHELEVALRLWPAAARARFRSEPDLWIAASGAVGRMLTGELGAPEERVRVHREFLDVPALAARSVDPVVPARLRASVGIPPDAPVVMGSGTLDWRKGPDLFVQLAAEVRRRSPVPVHFVWVGGEHRGADWERFRSDLDRAGAEHVHLVGTQGDPVPWYSVADVFALTSREDALPLVGLEHAALGHPIVTYRSGGITELLDAAGPAAAAGAVEHLDVGALADRVLELVRSPELRRTTGDDLRRAALAGHDVSIAGPRLLADLDDALERGPGG